MDASAETLYFTDVSNHCLRSVDLATGVIATIAGRRPPEMGASPAGDGGPATEAAFSTHPMRVALDAVGHLYVTDAHQNRVRRIDAATGHITTVAGNGEEGFAGDGGPATAASLAVPHGCRFDRDGNAFIADTHNHRIRRVDAATGVITTVAGTGEKGYSGDGLPALESKLYGPLAVDAAANGDLYIVDTDNLRFRCLEAATGILRTVAGCGQMGPTDTGIPALEAKFGRPRDIRVRGGQVYLVDGNNSSLFRLDLASGMLHRAAGTGSSGFSGDGGPAAEAQLDHCYSMAIDPAGNIYVKDSGNGRIRRVDAESGLISTVAGRGERGFSGDGGPALEAALNIG